MRPPSLDPEQRRALHLLARNTRGQTEAIMLAHGFTVDMLGGLVLDGLITTAPETVRAGGRPVQVVRMMITAVGRRAIAGSA
jgi:hypothetical protein